MQETKFMLICWQPRDSDWLSWDLNPYGPTIASLPTQFSIREMKNKAHIASQGFYFHKKHEFFY